MYCFFQKKNSLGPSPNNGILLKINWEKLWLNEYKFELKQKRSGKQLYHYTTAIRDNSGNSQQVQTNDQNDQKGRYRKTAKLQMLAVFACAVTKQQQNHVLKPRCWVTSSQAQTFKRICALWRLKWSAPAPSVLQLPWGCLGEVRGAGFLQPHRWGAPARQCLTLPRTDRLPPWAFMEWKEWRELRFNLPILLVWQLFLDPSQLQEEKRRPFDSHIISCRR